MKTILTPEDKKNLRRLCRIMSSYGMKEGNLETDSLDYLEQFTNIDFGPDYWQHFSNNYTVEIPDFVQNILYKVMEQAKKNFSNRDIDVYQDINYARIDLDIDVEDETITVKLYYSYYDVGDSQGLEISIEDDDTLEQVFEEISEISGDRTLVLRYNGSGDSGYIEGSFENGEPVPASIEDYCYRVLERKHGGWEINEGSQGEFIFDTENKTLTLDHQYNIEESFRITLYEEFFGQS